MKDLNITLSIIECNKTLGGEFHGKEEEGKKEAIIQAFDFNNLTFFSSFSHHFSRSEFNFAYRREI
jgi:hypothetical protein